MEFKKISVGVNHLMRIEQFKELDYHAVEHFQLPIELMMENAGLQLANVIASHATKQDSILIGVGNGNNGGGGLVAARRLSSWGFKVYLDIWGDITKPLVRKQLDRAKRCGVSESSIDQPDVWVDAYLGFSQRLPLPEELVLRIKNANQSSALKVSLDIPAGFSVDNELNLFKADIVLTLAAPKEELQKLGKSRIYVADLGIPHSIYELFGKEILPFEVSNSFQVNMRLYIPEKVQKIRGSHSRSISALHESIGLPAFIETYANDLERDFGQKKDSVLSQILNYYRPLMGKSKEEVFATDLKQNNFLDISAAVHGFKAAGQIPDVMIDFLFEKAVELLLTGDYFGLKVLLQKEPQLINQSSKFGHRAQLIHYCSSNAVEMYRQVVPENLQDMIELLISNGADPKNKIPVYGGEFDFFQLFESSAHPSYSGCNKDVYLLFNT